MAIVPMTPRDIAKPPGSVTDVPPRSVEAASLRIDPTSTRWSPGIAPPFATRAAGRLSSAADALSQLAQESLTSNPTKSHQFINQLINLDAITERVLDALSPMATTRGVQLHLRQTLGRSIVRCSAPAGMRLLNHFLESLIRIARPTDHLVLWVRHFVVPAATGDPRRRASQARLAVQIEHESFITTDADVVHESVNTALGGDVRCRDLLGPAFFECRDISEAVGGRLWSERGSLGGIAYCIDFPAHDQPPPDHIHDGLP
jgi:hypothetical protein